MEQTSTQPLPPPLKEELFGHWDDSVRDKKSASRPANKSNNLITLHVEFTERERERECTCS